jgi:tetratricopeptide (TPR) repeat protein
MKNTALFVVVVFATALSACAQEAKPRQALLGAEETLSVARIITNCATHEDKLLDLYDESQSPLRKKIIIYYQSVTNRVSAEQKIVIAACMGKENDFHGAAKLLEEYVQVFTNSMRGWTMLGTSFAMLDQHEKALSPYERAIALGDEASISGLCGSALFINRLDVVKRYVPDLLRLKDAKQPPEFIKQEIIGILAVYAVKTNEEDLFLKALDKVNIELLLPREDVLKELDKACKKFNSPKLKEVCQKISEAVEKTKAKN